jgi:hypothetical protein
MGERRRPQVMVGRVIGRTIARTRRGALPSRVRRTLSVVATAAHVLLAFTPLALVAYVARRLQTDSCNHVGCRRSGSRRLPRRPGRGGGLRWALWRRLDGLAVSALLPGSSRRLTVPLDRCNLLIATEPSPRGTCRTPIFGCCAHVPRMPVCRAAEAARAAAARERSWQLATGSRPGRGRAAGRGGAGGGAR